MDESGDWVCPKAKPTKVYTRLLNKFSTEGKIVLDFFSEGQGLKLSLFQGRDYLCFVDTKRLRDLCILFA